MTDEAFKLETSTKLDILTDRQEKNRKNIYSILVLICIFSFVIGLNVHSINKRIDKITQIEQQQLKYDALELNRLVDKVEQLNNYDEIISILQDKDIADLSEEEVQTVKARLLNKFLEED